LIPQSSNAFILAKAKGHIAALTFFLSKILDFLLSEGEQELRRQTGAYLRA
jgi:hypothetical protein